MFGLFKKRARFNSPEDKLRHELEQKMKEIAWRRFNKTPLKDTHMGGTILIGAITDTRNYFLKKSTAISNQYNVNNAKTVRIIRDCAESIKNEFID